MNKIQHSTILFDGVCNFCNFWVNFLINRDKEFIFKFAPLQSAIGQELLKKYNLNTEEMDSFILISREQSYKKSTAALIVARKLGGFFILLYPLIFLPVFIRDYFYDLIASNRYKLFGKKESCRIPSSKDRDRFLA